MLNKVYDVRKLFKLVNTFQFEVYQVKLLRLPLAFCNLYRNVNCNQNKTQTKKGKKKRKMNL